MKRRGSYGLMLFAIIVSILILGASHSSAQSQVTVALSSIKVGVAESGEIDGMISCPGGGCSGFTVVVRVDPEVLLVDSAEIGPYLGTQVFKGENTIDNVAGTVRLSAAALSTPPAVENILFQINVTGLVVGDTQVSFDSLDIIDSSGNPVSSTGQPGTISVIETGKIPPFSPRGYNWEIAFTSDRDGNLEVYVMDANGSNVRRLTNNPAKDSAPAWSPGGSLIAFSSERDGNSEIYVMNADGSDQRRLTDNPGWDGTPSWSPDGSQIAFASDRDGNSEIYVMNADGSNVSRLTNDPAIDEQPAWSLDGQSIAFVSFRGGSSSEMYMMDPNGANVRQITNSGGANIWYPAWSPDNSRMSITSELNNAANLDVLLPDGSGLRQLTQESDKVTLTDWSPDSRFIAYMSTRTGNANLYAMDVDAGHIFWLTNGQSNDTEPDWKRLASAVPCAIRTDRSDVPLRVGPGLNRGEYGYLPQNQDYLVIGQYTEADGTVWYELDKNEFGAADIVNSLWVAQSDVNSSGNCSAVPPAEPPPLILPQPTPSNEWGDCGSCDTCGHPAEECQTAPGGECVWNPETCGHPPDQTPPPEGTPPPQGSCYMVSTGVNPSGSGSVAFLTQRNCGRLFLDGTVVQLQANPASGWYFSSWSGSCGATGSANPVTVTVHSNCSVIGNFLLVPPK